MQEAVKEQSYPVGTIIACPDDDYGFGLYKIVDQRHSLT